MQALQRRAQSALAVSRSLTRRAAAAGGMRNAAAGMMREEASRRLRVAIAEDDDEQRWALELALSSEGFEVVSFEDGAELLDFFELKEARKADVIIADLNMPGRSGLEGLEHARAQGLSAPIFVVTGENSLELRNRVARLGNALFLQKPIDAARLAEAIYRVAALNSEPS